MNNFRLAFAVFLLATAIPASSPALSIGALKNIQSMMRNMCKNKSGVTEEILAQAKRGDFPEDPKFKCYLKCCLGMMQTMKKDKITVEAAEKHAEAMLPDDLKESSLRLLHQCKNSKGTDGCDTAYQFSLCSYKFDKDSFIIPL